jgi:hypothetical protein
MSDASRSHDEPAGGDGLFLFIASLLIGVVTVEAVLLAFPGWWLMVSVLGAVVIAGAGVMFAVVRTIDNDTAFFTPPHAPRPESQLAPAKPLPASRAALTSR